MAVEVYVVGLRETMRAVRQMADDVPKEIRKEFRAAAAPMVADAKTRFRALGRTGPRTAGTVRGSFTQSQVSVQMGGRGRGGGFELGTEFGAKDRVRVQSFVQRRPSGPVRVVREMNYSKVFGPWTGNQFTVGGGQVSGNAFYPAVRDHYDDLVDGVARVVDKALDTVVRAGGS